MHRYRVPTRGVMAAFTLIELLVVVAIITIIAAILFPVFAHVRDKARQASCLSNEKQIAIGWRTYIDDYDDTFPFILNVSANDLTSGNIGDHFKSPVVPGVTGQEPRFQLVTLLAPYVKNQALWYCPSVGPHGTCEACVKGGEWKKGATMGDQGTSYLYNYVCWPMPYTSASYAKAILLGGEGYGILLEPARWPMLREWPDGSGFTGNLSDPPASAIPHAGGMNVAYGDGHVKFYRMETSNGPFRHIGDGLFPGQ